MLEQTGNVILVIAILIIGAGLGLLAGFVLGKHKGQEMARNAKAQELEESRALLQDARNESAELASNNAAARAQIEGLNQQLAFVKSQLTQAQQAEQIRIQHERERAAAEAEERRKAEAKAAEEKRLADARAAETKRQEQESRLKEQSKVLEALAPVAKNLDALQNKVTQIEEGRKQEMGALGAQLKGLNDQQARLDKETSSLSAALRNNKVRGAWGEAQLKNIVESAGLLEHVDFDTQVVVTGADGRTLRPDMIVHLPGGKTIPIDAKVPYADYQRACEIPETASPEDLARRDDLLRSHARALRDHVRALGEKAYWNAFTTAPDFVVAFIPNEALLQAALEADPTLMDDAFSRKVALTSPVTLWAVLKSVAYAWQQQSLTDDAKQLFDLSRELYERFAVLGDYATKLGTQISKTVGAYNKFAASLERRVLPTARKLQKIEPTKVIEEVPLIESDKGNINELSAPEVISAEGSDAA
ncbi:DNA recombination protein RmuC [Bifidobacterium imperatoris]|uniref:30S ribosomal protein S9 n=1 Tax=Bifidobacterium imperatoris TaxID=2020965 RepID=A0A2N5ISD4_9BIFI|nr:DNA recombination protein RmuC [Bifidobacterium imperatoris]PLS24857.1 30S ribosomal protein S9 [Bifidobacterium imperatoris]QSY58562.1 DNA recombination protein RmuC [Bifidobacterium imperatoris]